MSRSVKSLPLILLTALFLTGCSSVSEESFSQSNEKTTITLSDETIYVNGKAISSNQNASVYAGAEIVYYEEGKGDAYGEGKDKDAHSREEADKHTVITITKPGTYELSGKLSAGQIAVDLGKNADENPKAVVNLILNNAEITCTVAPSIVVYHAYECSDKKTKPLSKEETKKGSCPQVNTSQAGFRLILAENSSNIINGSYVAKIYQDGTDKKKYKLDGAITSEVSFEIQSEANGKLTVNAENEGISSELHLTIHEGEIRINSFDDAINANEDEISVITVNGGKLICNGSFGKKGDGIDSNGYLVINDGFISAAASPEKENKGLDADLGIYLNSGTVFAGGNAYDPISLSSQQDFLILPLEQTAKARETLLLTDRTNQPVMAFTMINDCSVIVVSSSLLHRNMDYQLHRVSSVNGYLEENIYTNITNYEKN